MKQNDKQIPVILIVDDVEVNARLLKKMEIRTRPC